MNLTTCTLVHHFLENSAERFPDKTALVHDKTRVTFSEINAKANQLADFLQRTGISRGDRIALIYENSLEYVICYYGGLKAGAVMAPLSTGLKANSLRELLADLQPTLIIASEKFENLLQASRLSDFDIKKVVLMNPKLDWSDASLEVTAWHEALSGAETSDVDRGIDESDLASIIYTSGSTGKAKGVMLSHKNIVANTDSICEYLKLNEHDIQMVVLPFFYVMGKSLLNTHYAVGGSIVINNKFAFPAAVLEQMVTEKVTGLSGVPSTFAYLLYHSPLAKYRDRLSSLRYCSQAGGHMSRQIKEELREVLPLHTDIVVMYGATEASARLSYLATESFREKIDSIGKAIPGVTLKILDENKQEVVRGQTGELVASGTNIMLGYWNNEEATRKALDHHGYHTGDQSYQDEDGFFYLTGRKDNLLKVGGHKINPQEVEDAIMETELVVETAVIGVPDDLLGHKMVALVAPKSRDCTEMQLLGSCAEKLPKYKLPGKVKMLRALPKSLSGKIDRAKCIELAEKE